MILMYLFVALGIILLIIGLMSNEEIEINLATSKRKKHTFKKFETKVKTESNQNIILVGALISGVIITTTIMILKITNGIIDAQGTGKTIQTKYEIQKPKQIENNYSPIEAKQYVQEKRNNEISQHGDIVIGYNEREDRNQEYLKIGKEYKILNIDESGNLKWHLGEIIAGCGGDEWCEKNRLFDVIKKIPYQTDPDDGWKYDMKPIEVLNYNKGDCDERSFTLASLLLERKYKAVIIYTNNRHAFVCMNVNNARNINPHHAKLRINGLDYYYAETTNENGYLGAYNKVEPKDFIGVYDINKKRLIPKKEIEFYRG